MTLPLSLSELDAESEAEHELSRVSLVVGGLQIDVGLPPKVAIADFINDVIDIANEQLAADATLAEIEFDNTEDTWTLARLGAAPIEPGRSLTDAGVHDGELLTIAEVGQPISPLLFDDVDDAGAAQADTWARLSRDARQLSWFGAAVAATAAAALVLPRLAHVIWAPAAALVIGALFAATACVTPYRPLGALRAEWLAAAALPLIFGGALFLVPNGFGAQSLPMAFALSALASMVVLLVSGRGRTLHSGVIALSLLAGAGAVVNMLWHLPPRSIGAGLATVSVISVYLSPRLAVLLAKLPIPRVPTAGEPLDDIETQGGTTVEGVNAIGKQIIPTEEGVARRVRRANQYLTGVLGAAALTAAAGCYLADDVAHGFFWQGTAFAITVATALCLRGRSHHDLAQSAVLIGSGLVIALAVIVKTAARVPATQLSVTVTVVVIIAVVAACGIVAPRLEFSPVMRRQVELLEYLAIGLVFPLCFWIVRLYAFFRELRI